MTLSFSIRHALCLLGLVALTAGAARAQLTILPLGDSITYGFLTFTPPDYRSDGYRLQLYNDLGGSPSDVTFLGSNTSGSVLPPSERANEGHNGYTIEGIEAELTADNNTQPGRSGDNNGGFWLTGGNGTGRGAINPQVVLLDVGTNDATDGEDAVTMEAQLTQLLNDLKTDLPDAQIFVGNLTPRLDSPTFEAVEDAYNADIPTIVASEDSANFHFVDLHDAVSPSNIDAAGGYQHPDAAGYAQMGDAWDSALVESGVVPEPSTYALMAASAVLLVVISRRSTA